MKYWMSSDRMTVFVETDANRQIVDTAPITRRFLRQPLYRLVDWMKTQGGFEMQEIR